MSRRRVSWPIVLLAAAVVVLPVGGSLWRRTQASGCVVDGLPIEPAYRVETVDSRGVRQTFCCLRCAEIWRHQQATSPQEILVTDETTGEMIDARAAWYVRSTILTTPKTGNRIHVFRNQADAEKHADNFGGTVLSAEERPFR